MQTLDISTGTSLPTGTNKICVNKIQANSYKVVTSHYLRLGTSHDNGLAPENETSHLYLSCLS